MQVNALHGTGALSSLALLSFSLARALQYLVLLLSVGSLCHQGLLAITDPIFCWCRRRPWPVVDSMLHVVLTPSSPAAMQIHASDTPLLLAVVT